MRIKFSPYFGVLLFTTIISLILSCGNASRTRPIELSSLNTGMIIEIREDIAPGIKD